MKIFLRIIKEDHPYTSNAFADEDAYARIITLPQKNKTRKKKKYSLIIETDEYFWNESRDTRCGCDKQVGILIQKKIRSFAHSLIIKNIRIVIYFMYYMGIVITHIHIHTQNKKTIIFYPHIH